MSASSPTQMVSTVAQMGSKSPQKAGRIAIQHCPGCDVIYFFVLKIRFESSRARSWCLQQRRSSREVGVSDPVPINVSMRGHSRVVRTTGRASGRGL